MPSYVRIFYIKRTSTLLALGFLMFLAACDTSVGPDEPEDCYHPSPMEPDVCVPFASYHWYPAWAPDGNRIAYLRPDDETEIVGMYVFNLTTKEERRVLHGPDNMSSQAWSPDGEWLTFSSGAQIYKVRQDGSELIQLTFERENFDPAWSPDGEWIAYTDATPVPHDEVGLPREVLKRGTWFIRPDGSQKQWRPYVRGGAGPIWHPSGEKIISFSLVGSGFRVFQNYLNDPARRDTIDLGDRQGIPHRATYIGDSDDVVYDFQYSESGKARFDVFRLRPATGHVKRLTGESITSYGIHVAASPDGQTIAYVNNYWRERVVWLMDIDGSNKRPLGPVAPPFVPPFSSDPR